MPPSPETLRTPGPPAELDPLIEWFDRFCADLVLLKGYPLVDVRASIQAFDGAVRGHISGSAARDAAAGADEPARRDRADRLEAEHRRFATSLEQLWWFYGIVAADDHGGNRQALGQYGRLVAQSLREHRGEERGLPRPGGPLGRPRGPAASPRKP